MTRHPDFTGVWRADFNKCSLEIDAPASSVFAIQHNDPFLLLSRTHRAHDYEDTFALELSTDGEEHTIHKQGTELRCRCVWQGASLCFHARFLLDGVEAQNDVSYSMSPDGKEIVADEKFNGPSRNYHNRWVLVRHDPQVPDQ